MVAPTAVEMVNTDCIRITNPNEDGNPDSINIPNKSKPTVDHIVLSRTENQSSARPPAWMVLLQRNIDQVKAAVQTEPQGSDLRMLLFTAAASNERYASTLVPLPPQFRATAGSGCQVEDCVGPSPITGPAVGCYRRSSTTRRSWPSWRPMMLMPGTSYTGCYCPRPPTPRFDVFRSCTCACCAASWAWPVPPRCPSS